MRYYENLFIVNPGYEDDALQSIKDEYTKIITDNGGRIYNVEDWGKRRLAYAIEKQKYGTYVLMEFGVTGAVIRELEESQRLNDAVLAQLTVRLDEEPDLSKERKRYAEDEGEELDDEEMDTEEEVDAEDSEEDGAEEADAEEEVDAEEVEDSEKDEAEDDEDSEKDE